MVIAVRAAMSHYAPHLLFFILGALCVVLCAPPPLARFLVLLGFTSDGIRCRKKGSGFLAAFRMFIPRDYIPL